VPGGPLHLSLHVFVHAIVLFIIYLVKYETSAMHVYYNLPHPPSLLVILKIANNNKKTKKNKNKLCASWRYLNVFCWHPHSLCNNMWCYKKRGREMLIMEQLAGWSLLNSYHKSKTHLCIIKIIKKVLFFFLVYSFFYILKIYIYKLISTRYHSLLLLFQFFFFFLPNHHARRYGYKAHSMSPLWSLSNKKQLNWL
jgi:hypothetical protein